MKYFLMLALFFYSQFALSYSHAPLTYSSDQCIVVVEIRDVSIFKTRSEAESFCRSIYNVFDFSSGCFVRSFGKQWESNFGFSRSFFGNSSINDYVRWSRRTVHRGYGIRHSVFYSGKCEDEYPY